MDRVKAMDWKATLTPDDPRSQRDDVGDGSEYASKARPPQKRAVERENSPLFVYIFVSVSSTVSWSIVQCERGCGCGCVLVIVVGLSAFTSRTGRTALFVVVERS